MVLTAEKWITHPNVDVSSVKQAWMMTWGWYVYTGVHWGSKSTRGWVVRKDDSRSGGPCVFRRMGDSLGVNSGTLRLTCQVWPCSSFEQDNPGGHTMPACWGICTWRTESLEGLKGGMQVRSLIFMCVCVIHYNKSSWASPVSKT